MEKDTASWIRDPKIEHQKKLSLPARAEHSSLPAAPQAKQLSPAALLQACPSPQAGSTGADKPSVPSAHPEGPVVQSPARPRRLLPPTNTSSSFRVPPPKGHREQAAPLAPGRQEGGRQELFRTRAAGTASLARVSAAWGGCTSAPCPATAPRRARATQRFPAGKGLCWKLLQGHTCLEKKKSRKKKVRLNILPLAGVILLLACQFGQRQRAPGICSPDVADLGTDCARWGLISLCALMAVSERDLGQMAQPRGKERHLALVPGATGGMETQEHEARCSLPAAPGDVSQPCSVPAVPGPVALGVVLAPRPLPSPAWGQGQRDNWVQLRGAAEHGRGRLPRGNRVSACKERRGTGECSGHPSKS